MAREDGYGSITENHALFARITAGEKRSTTIHPVLHKKLHLLHRIRRARVMMSNGKFLYWVDELCKEYSDLVKKKCANLGELTKAGFQVPLGFVISVSAYDKFLKETGALDEIRQYFATFNADPNDPKDMPKYTEASRIVRALVESKRMPPRIEEATTFYYSKLCIKTGVENLFVSTRSAGPMSHPGQYETYLSRQRKTDVLQLGGER